MRTPVLIVGEATVQPTDTHTSAQGREQRQTAAPASFQETDTGFKSVGAGSGLLSLPTRCQFSPCRSSSRQRKKSGRAPPSPISTAAAGPRAALSQFSNQGLIQNWTALGLCSGNGGPARRLRQVRQLVMISPRRGTCAYPSGPASPAARAVKSSGPDLTDPGRRLRSRDDGTTARSRRPHPTFYSGPLLVARS